MFGGAMYLTVDETFYLNKDFMGHIDRVHFNKRKKKKAH